MSESKIWSKTPPKVEGWYWIKNRGINPESRCPAYFRFSDGRFYFQTGRGENFSSWTIDKHPDLRYGPSIEYPE